MESKQVIKFEKITYTVSEYLLSALINNDYSGLNESEELNLNYFTRGLDNTFEQYHFSWINDEQSFLATCEILNLMSDCITLEVLYTKEREFN
jgi:hypothetical protein